MSNTLRQHGIFLKAAMKDQQKEIEAIHKFIKHSLSVQVLQTKTQEEVTKKIHGD